VCRQNNKFLYGRGHSEDWRHMEIKTNVCSHQKGTSQTASDENNELHWLRSHFLVRSRITVLIGNWLTKLNLPHHSWLSISWVSKFQFEDSGNVARSPRNLILWRKRPVNEMRSYIYILNSLQLCITSHAPISNFPTGECQLHEL